MDSGSVTALDTSLFIQGTNSSIVWMLQAQKSRLLPTHIHSLTTAGHTLWPPGEFVMMSSSFA